jgi:2-oxoglutarate ferredoxin oxidoreductase subunit alpha
VFVVEMNTGQMLEDVQRAVAHRVPVRFFGTTGGKMPFPDEILAQIQALHQDAPTASPEWLEDVLAAMIA